MVEPAQARRVGRRRGALGAVALGASVSSVVVGALGLGTAGAVAAEAAEAPQTTTLVHTAVDRLQPPPVVGSSIELTAQLFAGSQPLAGQHVRFRVDPYGDAPDRLRDTVTTDASGMADGAATLRRCSTITAKFLGTADYAPSQVQWVECVAPRVSIAISDRDPVVGRRVVITGTTRPAQPGRVVKLWTGDRSALTDNPRKLLAKVTTNDSGRYRLVHRFAKPGRYSVFTTVDSTRAFDTGYSGSRAIRVHRG